MQDGGGEVARLFDATLYWQQRPELSDSDPLAHYLAQGWREGVRPHILFDPDFYFAHRPDLQRSIEPLEHFARHGWREGAQPHPAFSVPFYLSQQPDLGVLDPLTHYVMTGWREGLSPHPLFDPSSYAARRGAVAEAHLADYLRAGGPCDPSPLVDEAWYRATYGVQGPALPDYLGPGWQAGRTPHPYFDPALYGSQVGVTGMPEAMHYLLHGEAANVIPNVAFAPRYYAQAQGLAPGQSALLHFIAQGEAAGADLSEGFRSARYRSRYMSFVSETRPLRHFLAAGQPLHIPAPLPRPAYDGPAVATLVLLADCSPDQWRELGADPGPGVQPCAVGWVTDAAGPWPQDVPARVAVLLEGAWMARADLQRLAAAALERPAHPLVIDRQGDVVHAGFAVQAGLATPRHPGGDPRHPDLRVWRDGLVTPGPAIAAPLAIMAACWGAPDRFLRISEGSRFVPAAEAIAEHRATPVPCAAPDTPARPGLLLVGHGMDDSGVWAGLGYAVTLLPLNDMLAAAERVDALGAQGIRAIQAPFAADAPAYLAGAGDDHAAAIVTLEAGTALISALRDRWPGIRVLAYADGLRHAGQFRRAVSTEDPDLFEAAVATRAQEFATAAAADLTVVTMAVDRTALIDSGGVRHCVVIGHPVVPGPAYAAGERGGIWLDDDPALRDLLWPRIAAARPDIAHEPRPDRARIAVSLGVEEDGIDATLAAIVVSGLPLIGTTLAADRSGFGAGCVTHAETREAMLRTALTVYDDLPRLQSLSDHARKVAAQLTPEQIACAWRQALSPDAPPATPG